MFESIDLIFIIDFSIGAGIEDVLEVERHPFFGNIHFRMYEEKKVRYGIIKQCVELRFF